MECSRTNKINETCLNTGEPHFPDQIIDPEVKKRIIELGPYQPVGPFPYDGKQGRSFSDNYFTLKSKSGLKLKRTWLCYSSKLDCVYCQPCWLFPQKGPVGGWDSGLRDWKHLSDRIKTHENSQHHADSCLVYEQWRRHGSIDDALEKGLKEERNFWRKVLKRVLDVSLMLATCNLPFRGDSWHITDRNKGNFLSLIELLSKYDTILEDLITRPSGTVNYLSPTIQNEIISLMASEVLSGIKEELLSAPFFSIIYDTTQDVSKVDQLSEVFRYVKIDHDQLGKPCELRICETFTSFTAVTDQTASGLEDVIIKSISEKGLDITKCRGQGYDGASVMSGVYNGVQKRIQELAPHAYFIHCASHNLNLVLKDAVECNREIAQFFETVQNIYSFFGHSIVRWQELKVVSGCTENPKAPVPKDKVTLKTLNPTRWAGRYEAVYALKERFGDVMKALNKIILTSKKPKERNEAEGLKKRLESFSFVLLLTVQCKILGEINIASKSLQTESIDLMTAYDLLGNALLKVTELRWSFEEVCSEAEEVCSKWGITITHEFIGQRARKVKKHFDELCEDQRLTDPKSNFRVTIFFPMVDTIVSQIDNRFKGMKQVIDAYKIVHPSFLASCSDEELRCEADNFVSRFSDDVTPLFKAQILSVRNAFQSKLKDFKEVKEVANLLLIENSSLASTYPDVLTACFMYLTVPVTVAKAERSFSKLKLIKNYLRSSMSQQRLTDLALLSIENDRARKIDFDRIIDVFASVKSRRKSF